MSNTRIPLKDMSNKLFGLNSESNSVAPPMFNSSGDLIFNS